MLKPTIVKGSTVIHDRVNSSGKVIGQIRRREWSTGWVETHTRKTPGARWSLSYCSHKDTWAC